ncbi:MAG: bifunctional diaminohydroxyphosphoribosylaminopyrimidine deaminase/5-amino-6-(5-phosphoribosylamino)uracil reductase RibD [Chloracidobacterium sp.]|uniref:Riboflavin biosynthesis protein RibD n=1 Tax=Chloracidobacterium validum TaxID=2821543 RepID=A0ABX8B982_9BACT|nr:bifunctional diaminohydroxyphosphoribosylaminopyrimidine deaminase/5-amino-6-(5-phosphoribosylamino)uracil reductase RibD [Chloracidobacterium validum]QUW03229.1 bifunctional diaminohydroxyphosphoribosylaminopyrimidine deaminase/5-amino-6-(5-phosphoribosylamino)uracil reductase RibD [Chloracidobacterium validum]
MMPSQHDILMRETLRLAEQGYGRVSPRPLVGSLVVQQGVIVGRGFYHEPEPAHAEVWALREAGARARGATLYVNLEPCSHHGRTPPCTEAIIAAGIHRVVASIRDPNPQVNGRGFEQLRAAGIEVLTDVLAVEGVKLNEVFIVNQLEHRPFVHLKLAVSLDGKIATCTGQSQWLTGAAARLAGQNLRHRYDAIAVGMGTVLADDPQLTDRTGQYRHRPLARVVFGSARARLPLTGRLAQTARQIPTWLVTVNSAGNTADLAELEELGVRLLRVEADAQGRPHLDQSLAGLFSEGIASLLVEGGSALAGTFVDHRLVDKVTWFIAPRIIGGATSLSAIGGCGAATLNDTLDLAEVTAEPAGSDWALTGYAGQTIKQALADAHRAAAQLVLP